MSGILLDTHVLLLVLQDSHLLTARLRRQIENADAVYVSAASVLEIAGKKERGKLQIPARFAGAIEESGFEMLPIHADHAAATMDIHAPQGDLYDRILLAQARVEGLLLLTIDRPLIEACPDLCVPAEARK